MKRIELFDKVINGEIKADKPSDVGICGTMFWAYRKSEEVGNEVIDFNDVIWENEVEQIVKTCKENNIKEFTISSTFSGLTEVLWELSKRGCKIAGLREVNAPYTDIWTKEYKKIPAVVIEL